MLTSLSSPVSATKSIQTSRPRRSVSVAPSPRASSTRATSRSRSPGVCARIQSRVSSWPVASRSAVRCRRWPRSAVLPNHRMPYGWRAPRRNATGDGSLPRGKRGSGPTAARPVISPGA